MDIGVGVGVPLGTPNRQGGGVIYQEMIGYTLVRLTTEYQRGSLAYQLTVNGYRAGSWWLYQQQEAMEVLQQWRGYLYNGGTVEDWLASSSQQPAT
jgi:hypothetical protein